MTIDESNVKLQIAFIDPDLDAEEREEEAQQLLSYLQQLDEVEQVDRVLDPNPPEGIEPLPPETGDSANHYWFTLLLVF